MTEKTLLERLEEWSLPMAGADLRWPLIDETIARITTLEAENAAMRGALKPFADAGADMKNYLKLNGPAAWHNWLLLYRINARPEHFEAARAALSDRPACCLHK